MKRHPLGYSDRDDNEERTDSWWFLENTGEEPSHKYSPKHNSPYNRWYVVCLFPHARNLRDIFVGQRTSYLFCLNFAWKPCNTNKNVICGPSLVGSVRSSQSYWPYPFWQLYLFLLTSQRLSKKPFVSRSSFLGVRLIISFSVVEQVVRARMILDMVMALASINQS